MILNESWMKKRLKYKCRRHFIQTLKISFFRYLSRTLEIFCSGKDNRMDFYEEMVRETKKKKKRESIITGRVFITITNRDNN